MPTKDNVPEWFKEENAQLKTGKRGLVDYEEFVRVYMEIYKEDGTRVDLARRLRISYESIAGRVEALKRKGVLLPALATSFAMTRKRVKGLQQLIDQGLATPKTPGGMKKPPVM
jgi:hypothetical protein